MANFAAHGHPTSGTHPAVLSRGQILDGKYRIEQPLAEGGVGIVVLATQLQLERPVAIKYLRPEALRQEMLVAQFEREARLAAKIRSEHVVRVHDVGVNQAIGPYVVMEFLEGGDLETLLSDGPLPVEIAVDYVLQACEGIAEAHELSIVHRDLKPANLFLANRPRNPPILKIIDFGISRIVPKRGSAGWSAEERTAVGTPAYMSPEQISGGDVDARADVWALGVVLFELLTAARPFDGASTEEVCDAILGLAPVRLTELRPDVPLAVEAIVHKCLEKDPARRYRTVGELAHALGATMAATSSPAEASAAPLSARRPPDPRTQNPTVLVSRRRGPSRAVQIALVAVVALSIAGAALLASSLRSREPAPTVTTAEPAAEPTAAATVTPATPSSTGADEPAPTSFEILDPATSPGTEPAGSNASDKRVAKPQSRPIAKPRSSAPKSDRSGLFGSGRQ
jgi:serine/threonine protein kinase